MAPLLYSYLVLWPNISMCIITVSLVETFSLPFMRVDDVVFPVAEGFFLPPIYRFSHFLAIRSRSSLHNHLHTVVVLSFFLHVFVSFYACLSMFCLSFFFYVLSFYVFSLPNHRRI